MTSPSHPPRVDTTHSVGLRKDQHVPGAGKLGMILFLMSLSVLFAAGMVGYLAIRLRADAWPPPGMPGLPVGLWLSTVILLAGSGTIHWALVSARRDGRTALLAALVVTLVLGVLFLVSQAANWAALMDIQVTASANLYGFTFFMLTGLHGGHVIGGLVLLAVVTVRAFRGRYTAEAHAGVVYSAMYWHFLDAVWLVMFTAMYLAA